VAVLLVQDMAVVPLAIMVELLTPGAGFGAIVWKIGRILLVAGLLVSGLYLVLNYVAVRALRSLSVMHNRELVVLLAVVVGLGSTWAAHAAGLSPALGAFTAGIFLGGSPFAVQVRADVSSIKIVLLTLFFGAVGLVANPVWMGQHIGTVLAVAAAIVVGKAAVTAVSLSLVGSSLGTALATGLCLAQVGEFAFVLGGSARAAGILKEEAYLTLVSATIATLLVTPYLMPLATRIGAMLRKRKVRAQSADESHGPRVLVVGFGPAGQAVGNALSEAKISATVMDVNPNAREMANGLGLHGEIGDATQWDVLEHTVGEQLCLAIITVPDFMAALTIQQHIRRLAPHARLVVRSRYERNETALREAGADLVIGDERQAGGELAAAALLFVEEFRYSQKAEEANAVSLTRSSIGPGLPS
jgi:CPA2 family monovalent cation:H+ antiporter-2